jgi:queuosine precursor transporter
MILKNKSAMVFTIITAFFVANALIAECIGVKIFSLEATLGLPVHTFSLFGENGLSYALTCGVLLWPIEFVMTDLVNEYYGPKMVRRISTIAIVLISYAFVMFMIASKTIAPDWWLTDKVAKGVPNYQAAFACIFGQSSWIIIGSLVAFGVSQLLDAYIFHKIKQRTGEGKLWLRATGSTIVSQLIDSYIVLFIAFQIGSGWSAQKVLAICMVNYSYKVLMALVLTPVINIVHHYLDNYFGKELADEMKASAMLTKAS